MKKAVAVIMAVVFVLTAGAEVFAFGQGGGMMGGGSRGGFNPNYNPQYNPNFGYTAIDPATAARCLAFEQSVLPLKQRLLELKIEMLTLQSQSTPDTNAISAKFAEIYSLKNQILQRAIDQSVTGLCKGAGRGF